MKLGLGLALLAGLALTVGLIAYQGAGEVFGTLSTLGWGLLPLVLVHAAQLLFCALGWRPLISRGAARPIFRLMRIRWIREGTNSLLPLGHIGGEIIGARMLAFQGLSGDRAGASVVVDLTTEVATQLLFTLAGLACLRAPTWAEAALPASPSASPVRRCCSRPSSSPSVWESSS